MNRYIGIQQLLHIPKEIRNMMYSLCEITVGDLVYCLENDEVGSVIKKNEKNIEIYFHNIKKIKSINTEELIRDSSIYLLLTLSMLINIVQKVENCIIEAIYINKTKSSSFIKEGYLIVLNKGQENENIFTESKEMLQSLWFVVNKVLKRKYLNDSLEDILKCLKNKSHE